jgi:hypothetical protein
MSIEKVARSLKIRILPNAEQKELLKQYAGTARYLHNQAKALAEGVSDRARATAIAGWEAEHDGTCKGEIAAKVCNKMKCKTHGEVSGCATQKQADSERTDAGSSKKATSVVVTLSIPKPCQVRSYDTSVIMSRVDAFGRRQNEPQPTPRRWKKLSEFVNTRDATLCSR